MKITDDDPRAVRHWWGWVRYITRRGGEYMNRYSLRRQLTSGHNPWRVYINHFLAGDDPGHHDHPSVWSFSIPLWGSYTEEYFDVAEVEHTEAECRFDGCPAIGVFGMHSHEYGEDAIGMCQWCGAVPQPPVKTRRVRWFNWIPSGKYHRITELHPSRFGGQGVVTLFVCGPLTGRQWGWWKAGIGHVPYVPEQTPGQK